MEVPGEMLARYKERRKQDLQDCVFSLEHQKYTEIEKVGHQLKGNGTTFGHPELSLIGKNMELAAKSHDMKALQKTLKAFSEWVNTLS